LAEELRGAGPGELVGRHITELAGADPRLAERQFQRFVREGAWVGQYPIRGADGTLVTVRSYAFTHQEDGEAFYLNFDYPVGEHTRLAHDGPVPLEPPALSPEDVCLGQLYIDGHANEEVAVLLGVSPERVGILMGQLIEHTDTASRTGACIRLLKAGLVV
jgi:DNA-binding CsgD family transcriptional regulator